MEEVRPKRLHLVPFGFTKVREPAPATPSSLTKGRNASTQGCVAERFDVRFHRRRPNPGSLAVHCTALCRRTVVNTQCRMRVRQPA